MWSRMSVDLGMPSASLQSEGGWFEIWDLRRGDLMGDGHLICLNM